MLEISSSLQLDIWSILLLFGAFHGLFLAVAIYLKGLSLSHSNSFFAAFLTAVSYILFVQFLHESQLMVYVPNLLATSTPVLFLLGPLFYLYVSSILERSFSLDWKAIIHLLPFLICVLTIIPFYLHSSDYKVNYILNATTGPVDLPYTRAIYYGLALLQNAVYWWLCYASVISADEQVKTFIKRWLSRSTVVYGGYLVVFLVVFCLFLFTDYYLREIRYGGYLLLSFIVHLYGYILLQESPPIENPQNPQKYTSSTLSKDEFGIMKQKLLSLVEEERIYLQAGLKIDDLAKRIKVQPHLLSQFINTEFDTNFNEFINTYRVREAKRLLRSEKYRAFSLEGIAMESGFNNRTSFYRVFKKHTGTTPNRYKEQQV